MRLALVFLAFLATACDGQRSRDEKIAETQAGLAQGLDRSKAGTPLPDEEISNAEGEASSLAAEAGEPLLVNLWATWCVPCVTELPTLQRLSDRPGAPRVIAVSQDIAPRGSVDAFLADHRLQGLEVWHDPEMSLSGGLGAEVLPTTIFYDAQGREVWRYVGDLDWTGAEAARLLAEAQAPEAG